MLRKAGPYDIRTIAQRSADDELPRPLAWRFGIEVVVNEGRGPRRITPSAGRGCPLVRFAQCDSEDVPLPV